MLKYLLSDFSWQIFIFNVGPVRSEYLPSLVWPHSGSWWFWQDLSQFALHHIEVRINALPPVSWIFPPWCLRICCFFLRKYFIRPKSEITCNLENNWAYSCFRPLSTRRRRKKCSTLPTKTRIRRLAGKSFRSFTFPSQCQRQRQRQSLYRQRQGFQELLGRVSSLSLFQTEHWSFCCFCAHRVISVSCENIFLSDNDQPASTAEASDPAQGDPTKGLPRVKSALAENLIYALLQ